ncbi:MAG: lysophospholipase [Candidatus Obscuribacterales bacterium]|nr:lysophospholipase [Candidatus Obscuribacterales bacterium]
MFGRLTKFSISALAALSITSPALALESTMPPQYIEQIKPEIAAQYKYSEDGEFSLAGGLPTYQWMPADGNMKAVIVGIHGLTLHGRRYRVLARTMAVSGAGFVSVDMRGFGRCKFQDDGSLKPKGERTEVNHELSYADILKTVQSVRAKYPGVPLIVMGESLGCTFCMRLAGEHPELVDGVILSAPAVRVNPKMYASPSDIKAGVKAIVSPSHQVNLHNFFMELVSSRPEVCNEMIDDPFIVKSLSLKDLLSTDIFVDKTVSWSRNTSDHLPLLVIQGSNDKCVVPKHLTDLMMNMKSDDMRIAWKGSYGHLQLETVFMRAPVIDSIGMWLNDHNATYRAHLKQLEQNIADLGGSVIR